MEFFAQAATFPALILPAFIAAALLLAILPWRSRAITAWLASVLALSCTALAVLLLPRGLPTSQRTAASEISIEADMSISRGNGVDLWVNDWNHPAERSPIVPGTRHVYRFIKVPPNIHLIRLDPTDVPNARIVIYGLTVKSGGQIVRQLGPAEFKSWNQREIGPPKEEEGGLAMLDTGDDPILWKQIDIDVPPAKPPERPSRVEFYLPSLTFGGLALLIAALAALRNKFPKAPERYVFLFSTGWATGLLVVIAAAGAAILQTKAAELETVIDVDMFVSRGHEVDLWLNDWQHAPEALPVVAGQRHVYRFKKVPRNITLLRLDPTDLPNARIVIYGVAVRNRSRIFQQFGPAELSSWSRTNLSTPQDENGGVALTDLNDDPAVTTPMALALPGDMLGSLSSGLMDNDDAPFLLAITGFLLTLLVRMTTRDTRIQALLIAAVCCSAFPVAFLTLKLRFLSPPVTSAVGYAAYMGYPKATEYVASLAMMLVSIALGCVFAKLAGPREEERTLPVEGGRQRYVWMAHAAVLAILVSQLLPNLMETLPALKATIYEHTGWDEWVSLHWMAMANMGLRPIRDFWYPYSGGFMVILPYPAGTLCWAFHCTLTLWVCYLALFRAAGRQLAQALTLFGLILAPVLMEILPGWLRYLLSVDLGLLYAALYSRPRLNWREHGPFAAFAGYTFFYEPTQVIYTGMGIATHTVVSILSAFHGNSLRDRVAASLQVLRQRLICIAAPMLAGIGAALLVYAATGMLPGLLAFERSLGDQGDYGAYPSAIASWVKPLLQPETVFLLMFLMASYAAYRWMTVGRRQHDVLGAALMVLCGIAFLAMQKQVTRPHAMMQIRLFPYAALLICGLILWRERQPAVRVAIAVFLGCVLAVAMHRHLVERFAQHLVSAPRSIAGTTDALLHHRQDFVQADATLFARSRFVGFDRETAVVDNLTQVCGLRPDDSIYVLGDYPVFYILLNQRPPYSSNMYNSSPINEQQKVLDWFEQKHPRFVVWGTDTMVFDSVPHPVRLPLIFNYVVQHYEFVRAIGPYQILAERPADHSPDLGYWQRRLTGRVDLGHIPARARLAEYADCGGDVSRCDAILVVRYPKAAPRGKATVDIGSFQVQFDLSPEKREYVVNLDRVWFWKPLAPSSPPIRAEDAGSEATLQYRRERKAVLY